MVNQDTIRRQVELGIEAKGFSYIADLRRQFDALKADMARVRDEFSAGIIDESAFNKQIQKLSDKIKPIEGRFQEATSAVNEMASGVQKLIDKTEALDLAEGRAAAEAEKLKEQIHAILDIHYDDNPAVNFTKDLANARRNLAEATHRATDAKRAMDQANSVVANSGGRSYASESDVRMATRAALEYGQAQRDVARASDELARAQANMGNASQAASGKVRSANQSLTETQTRGTAAARAALEFSRGLEDLTTGGFVGVLNNIPGMIHHTMTAMGAAPAMIASVTAAVSLLGTAVFIVYNNWQQLTKAFRESPIDTSKILTGAQRDAMEYEKAHKEVMDLRKKSFEEGGLSKQEVAQLRMAERQEAFYKKLVDNAEAAKEAEKEMQAAEKRITDIRSNRDKAAGEQFNKVVESLKGGGLEAIGRMTKAFVELGDNEKNARTRAVSVITAAREGNEKSNEYIKKILRDSLTGGKFLQALESTPIEDEAYKEQKKHQEDSQKKAEATVKRRIAEKVQAFGKQLVQNKKESEEEQKAMDEHNEEVNKIREENAKKLADKYKKVHNDSLMKKALAGEDIESEILENLSAERPGLKSKLRDQARRIADDIKASVEEIVTEWREIEKLTDGEIDRRRAAKERHKQEEIALRKANEDFTELARNMYQQQNKYNPFAPQLTQAMAEQMGKQLQEMFADSGMSADNQSMLAKTLNTRRGMSNVGLLNNLMMMGGGDFAASQFMGAVGGMTGERPMDVEGQTMRAMQRMMILQEKSIRQMARQKDAERRLNDGISNLEALFDSVTNQPAFQPRFGW